MSLTKKVNIENDALQVISNMTWKDNGGQVIGILPPVQLDRGLYVAVNKGLEALGGKWDRKAQGHLFSIDPRPQVDDLLSNGYVEVERDGFFETPVAVVELMISLLEEEPRGTILEPSAGHGALADALKDLGYHKISCIEKNEDRCKVLSDKGYKVWCGDFMEYSGEHHTVMMNPPFEIGQDVDHITHAFNDCLKEGGQLVSVVSEGPFFRMEQKYVDFRLLVNKYGYSVKLSDGSFKESGTGVNTRLVYLVK